MTAAIAVGATLGVAAPAQAAIVKIAPGHILSTLYTTSGLELTGYPNGAALTYTLTRPDVLTPGTDVTIGSGAVTIDNAGAGAVNPPLVAGGDGCWANFTPQILPGDAISVTVPGQAAPDVMIVNDVLGSAPVASGSTLTVSGHSLSPLGIPLTVVGDRLNPLVGGVTFDAGKLRAVGIPDLAGNWTLSFAGLDAHDIALATSSSSESRVDDAGAAANPNVTIGQTPGAPGPNGCAAPLGSNTVTGFGGRTVVDQANAGAPLVVQGVSAPDVTSVAVSVSSSGGGAPVTGAATLLGGAWTSSLNVTGLPDGTLTTKVHYTVPTGPGVTGGVIGAVDKSIAKDTVAPPAVTATPDAGAFVGAQSVSLSDADGTAQIRFSTSATPPTATTGTVFTGPISVASTQTLQAIAVDPAGNVSPLGSFGFTISAPPVVVAPTPAPPVVPGSVPALGLNRFTTTSHVKRARAASQGLRLVLGLQSGTQVLRIRVFRKVNSGPRKQISSGLRSTLTSQAGLFKVQLHDRALRHALTKGTFTIEVTPGRSQTDLGSVFTYTVHIV